MKDLKQISNEELLEETKKIYDDYQRAENDLDDDLEAAYRRMLEPYEREATERGLMDKLRKMCGVTAREEMA